LEFFEELLRHWREQKDLLTLRIVSSHLLVLGHGLRTAFVCNPLV
jgi:hypothetical protein